MIFISFEPAYQAAVIAKRRDLTIPPIHLNVKLLGAQFSKALKPLTADGILKTVTVLRVLAHAVNKNSHSKTVSFFKK